MKSSTSKGSDGSTVRETTTSDGDGNSVTRKSVTSSDGDSKTTYVAQSSDGSKVEYSRHVEPVVRRHDVGHGGMVVTALDLVRPPGGRVAARMAAPARTAADREARLHRPWVPRHLRVTRSAQEHPHAAEIVRRCEALGTTDIELLRGDRITGVRGETERETYTRAKATLAVVVSPDSARRLDPIPPSADWRVDLARGCPAHCQYCYLAGSLTGPPITRVYADLDRILAGLDDYVGHGNVTSTNAARAHEGTTFEASCYTDPLGIEPATGSARGGDRPRRDPRVLRPGAAAGHDEVRRRRATARPAPPRPDPAAVLAQPVVALRGRHRPGRRPGRGAGDARRTRAGRSG